MANLLVLMVDLARGPSAGLPDPTANLRWLEGMLTPIAAHINAELKVVCSKDCGGDFDAASVFRAAELPSSPEGWATLHSLTNWPESAAQRLLQAVEPSRCVCVVGFGLAPSVMRTLDQANISFIDLEIHPLRFLSDLFLRARTNSAALAAILKKAEVSAEAADPVSAAAFWLANVRVFGGGERYTGAGKLAVFVGQAEVDTALVSEGVIVQPTDMLAEIVEIASRHAALLVRPHPYEMSRRHLAPLFEAIPNAMLVNDPTYALLCERAVETVVALSSGVLVEAESFGKQTERLILPDTASCALGLLIKAEVRVGSSFFLPDVWANVLSSQSIAPMASGFLPGVLRHSYGRAWGFDSAAGLGPLPFLQRGETLTAADDSGRFVGLLGANWHVVEAEGVWSESERAIIALRCPPECERLQVQISDGVSDWRPGTRFSVRRIGAMADEGLAELILTDEPQWVEIDVQEVQGPIFLEFLCSRMILPADEGFEPPDPRRLGVLLHAITAD